MDADDWQVRLRAARALGRIADKQALPELNEVLIHPAGNLDRRRQLCLATSATWPPRPTPTRRSARPGAVLAASGRAGRGRPMNDLPEAAELTSTRLRLQWRDGAARLPATRLRAACRCGGCRARGEPISVPVQLVDAGGPLRAEPRLSATATTGASIPGSGCASCRPKRPR